MAQKNYKRRKGSIKGVKGVSCYAEMKKPYKHWHAVVFMGIYLKLLDSLQEETHVALKLHPKLQINTPLKYKCQLIRYFLPFMGWSVLRCASVLRLLIVLFRACLVEKVRFGISLRANFGQTLDWEPSKENPTSMTNDLLMGHKTQWGTFPSGHSGTSIVFALGHPNNIWTSMGFACLSDRTTGLFYCPKYIPSQLHQNTWKYNTHN